MEWIGQLLMTPLFGGLAFFIAGAIMWAYPPAKINSLYGYRTPSSMKSLDRWHFAQKFSACRLVISGLILILISLIGIVVRFDNSTQFIIEIALILLPVIYLVWSTEKALKQKFPN